MPTTALARIATILLAFTTPTMAAPLDATAFATRLRDAVETRFGVLVEWIGARTEGDDGIVLSSPSIGTVDGRKVPIGADVVLSGIAGDAGTGWTVADVRVGDFALTSRGGATLAVRGLGTDGFSLDVGTRGIVAEARQTVEAADVALVVAGQDVVSMRDATLVLGETEGRAVRDLVSPRFVVRAATWRDADATALFPRALAAMGYVEVAADLSLRTIQDTSGGPSTLLAQIDAPDAGRLKVSLDGEGVEQEALTSIEAALGLGGEVPSQEAVMSALSTIRLTKASVAYEDFGLAGRAVELRAKADGVDRRTVEDGVSAAIQALPVDMGLRDGIAKGVSAVLAGDGGLRVEADPGRAVPLAEIAGVVLTIPVLLPGLLGLNAEVEPAYR